MALFETKVVECERCMSGYFAQTHRFPEDSPNRVCGKIANSSINFELRVIVVALFWLDRFPSESHCVLCHEEDSATFAAFAAGGGVSHSCGDGSVPRVGTPLFVEEAGAILNTRAEGLMSGMLAGE